ncbi:major facilitator superfamily domain-containing protein, partial [Diaporthe sp. PMI_573]
MAEKVGSADEAASQAVEMGAARTSQPPAKSYSFYVSMFGLALVALITAWDATALAIALPAITQQLQGTTLQSFWASISFILGVAVTQPIYVSLSDVLGRKVPLYAATVIFTAGTIVFALANQMITLIVGRLIQGLGGGGLYVLQDIILTDMTNLKERPLYLGLISLAMASGTILGPIVGALFSNFNWRWIGWVNLPIIGVGFFIFVFFLHLRTIPLPLRTRLRRLDMLGMALFCVGAAAVAAPLSWAGALYPWSTWNTIVPLIIGVIVLAVFGYYERGLSSNSVLPFRIFTNSTAISSLFTGFVHGSILYTILLYIPLYFQAVLLEAPLEAGKSTLPICCFTVAFSFIAPMIIEFTRRYRVLIWLGWITITLSLGLWCLVDQNTPRAEIYVFQSLLGVGIGTIFTASQVPMQASMTDIDDTGLAVGTLIVVRLFGALIGLATGSAVFSSVFQKSIAQLGSLPEPVKLLEDSSQAINFISLLRTVDLQNKSALVDVYRIAFRAIWIVMTCLSGIGLLASFYIKDLTLEKEELGRQGFEHSST